MKWFPAKRACVALLIVCSACTSGKVTNATTSNGVSGAQVQFNNWQTSGTIDWSQHVSGMATAVTSTQASAAAWSDGQTSNSGGTGIYYLNAYGKKNAGDNTVTLVTPGWKEISVSAPGYDTAHFYRDHQYSSCGDYQPYTNLPYSGSDAYPLVSGNQVASGQCAYQSFDLWPQGLVHEKLPDMIVDPRTLRDQKIIYTKGVPSAPGDSPSVCPDINSPLCTCEGIANVCLRYSVGTINAGAGDLMMVAQWPNPPPTQDTYLPATQRVFDTAGVTHDKSLTQTNFLWHAAHNHFHLQNWTNTQILGPITFSCGSEATADTCPVVGQSQKLSFCLEDYRRTEIPALSPFDATLAATSNKTFDFNECNGPTADHPTEMWQGIGAGNLDVYRNILYGQLVSLDGLAPGTYWLRVEVNPVIPGTNTRSVLETDYTNNVARVQFTIP